MKNQRFQYVPEMPKNKMQRTGNAVEKQTNQRVYLVTRIILSYADSVSEVGECTALRESQFLISLFKYKEN